MKSLFCLLRVRSVSTLLSLVLPLSVLSACTVSEVAPEVSAQTGAQTGSGEANPEMAVRLPPFRLANRTITDIGALSADQDGKTMVIAGDVQQRSALLDGWLYQVGEASDSVWVLTERDAPQLGESVLVEGIVRHEPVVVGEVDASGVYLEEKSYREANE